VVDAIAEAQLIARSEGASDGHRRRWTPYRIDTRVPENWGISSVILDRPRLAETRFGDS